jgi:hypothetical protein
MLTVSKPDIALQSMIRETEKLQPNGRDNMSFVTPKDFLSRD